MFRIRKDEPGDVAKSYGRFEPSYVVIDEEKNRIIPFGRYGSYEQATMRVAREIERRDAK